MPTPALSAEPANAEEREQQNLPPKSYADAVEDESVVNGSKGNSITNGLNGTSTATGTNGTNSESTAASELGKHAASVLRIVDTGAPDGNEKKESRPLVERQESQHEYSATVFLLACSVIYY